MAIAVIFNHLYILKSHTGPFGLAGDPLELPQGPLGVPRLHFENQCHKWPFSEITMCCELGEPLSMDYGQNLITPLEQHLGKVMKI